MSEIVKVRWVVFWCLGLLIWVGPGSIWGSRLVGLGGCGVAGALQEWWSMGNLSSCRRRWSASRVFGVVVGVGLVAVGVAACFGLSCGVAGLSILRGLRLLLRFVGG